MRHSIDPAVIAGYLEDASGFSQTSAERLVSPQTPEETAEYLALAAGRREFITLSGGRTGVAAGCLPQGGTLLTLENLRHLGEVERTAQGGQITVGPGIRLSEVKAAAAAQGLIYGPDPTERTATLGGNVSTNASGGQSYRFGATRQAVLGLQAVLSSGEILNLRRGQNRAAGDLLKYTAASGHPLIVKRPLLPPLKVFKNAAGYFSAPEMDPIDLLIGMEGTLAVITSLTLRLLPAPAGTFALVFFFSVLQDAADCAARIRRPGSSAPKPLSLELMDGRSLNLLRAQFPQIPDHAGSCLMIEQDFASAGEEAGLSAWLEFLKSEKVPDPWIWFADTQADRERLREFRHALPETVNTIVRRRKFPKVGTDMAVPAPEFPEMLAAYTRGLENSGLDFLIFGHIGECHLHANVLPRTQEEYQAARALYLEFARKAVELGGTVSAEHGIGKIKHHFLEIMAGPEGIREMVRVKRAMDPALILNRGNIFPGNLLDLV